MTLQQLLYFRTAAQLGSFNAASRALHCTQPAVSDQVRRLESELGVSLFARAGRGLTLTSAGRVFLSHAERVTEAADDALASVGRRHAAREQVVTMGTFRNAPYYEIAELATRYCDRNPDARLRMRGQNSYDVARAVQDGELEAGLVVLPVDDSLLEVRVAVSRRGAVRQPRPLAHARAGRRRRRRRARRSSSTTSPTASTTRRAASSPPALRRRGCCSSRASRSSTWRRRSSSWAGAWGARSPRAPCSPARPCPTASRPIGFAEPFYDFFAVVTRRGVRVSPATKALLDLVDEWAETVAARL